MEIGIGLAGGCGGNGGGVELVPPTLVYDDKRCSSGNGFDGEVLLVVRHLVLLMGVVLSVEEFCMVGRLWQQQRRHPVPNRTPFEHQQQVQ